MPPTVQTSTFINPNQLTSLPSQSLPSHRSSLTAAIQNSGQRYAPSGQLTSTSSFGNRGVQEQGEWLLEETLELTSLERSDLNTGHTHGALSRTWQAATNDESQLEHAWSDKFIEPWNEFRFSAPLFSAPLETSAPHHPGDDAGYWHGAAGGKAGAYTTSNGPPVRGIPVPRHQEHVEDACSSHAPQPSLDVPRQLSTGHLFSGLQNPSIGPLPTLTPDDRILADQDQLLSPDAAGSRSTSFGVISDGRLGVRSALGRSLDHHIEEDAVQEDDDFFAGDMEIDFDDQDWNVDYPSEGRIQPELSDNDILSGRPSQSQSFSNSYEETGLYAGIAQPSQSEYQRQQHFFTPFPDLEDPTRHHLNPSHDCGALGVPDFSNRFQNGVPGSFPTTAHAFPPDIQERLPQPAQKTTQPSRPRGLTMPGQFPRTPSNKLPDRSRPSTRKSRTNSMSAVSERATNGLQKGRRKGQLAEASAKGAAQKRKEKSTCIICRYRKVTCGGKAKDSSCEQCLKSSAASKAWSMPCEYGHFLDMIEEDTCNYIFQSFCCHATLDGRSRIKIQYPTDFSLPWLIGSLQQHHKKFNIEVESFSGTKYTLDLGKSLDLLQRIFHSSRAGPWQLRDLIESKSKRVSVAKWMDCVTGLTDDGNKVEACIKFNNMPSRNKYGLVPIDHSTSRRPLDVTSPEDKDIIILGVQLCRIVLRALEIAAFKKLQTDVGEISKSGKESSDIHLTAGQVGRILLNLRWRLAWWELVENGRTGYIDVHTAFIARVRNLARTLYFWYCAFKKKLQTFKDAPDLPVEQCSTYADSDAVWEDFPTDDTPQGFEEWLGLGHGLVIFASQVGLNITY